MPFGQHQYTELRNNQFPETEILGLPVSRRMRALVYMVSSILFPRAHDPSGLWQGSRALVWSNTGSPRFTDFPSKSSKSDWMRIRNEYSAHAQKIGSSQSSRSLPQASLRAGSLVGRVSRAKELTRRMGRGKLIFPRLILLTVFAGSRFFVPYPNKSSEPARRLATGQKDRGLWGRE